MILLSSCNLSIKVDTGDLAYQLKHYGLAADLYAEEYEKASDNNAKAYAASMASKSFMKVNDLKSAFDWIVTRMQVDRSAEDLDNLAALALAQEDFLLAEKAYQQLYKSTSNKNYLSQVGYIKALKYDKKIFNVESTSYNSEYSDYSPQLFESNYITFTSERASDISEIDTYTGRHTSDIYLVGKKNLTPFTFDQPINSSAAEGHAAFNQTFDEVYFTRCEIITERNLYCRIYQSRRQLGNWSEPQPIIFFQESVNVGHPAYLESDSLLIFSAKNDDNHQLYSSRKMDNGWTLPEMMPSKISTPYNEKFPVIDGDTLYYSSDRFPGFGGLDIYKSYIDQSGYWTDPEVLAAPYNSGADDFGYCVLERFAKEDNRIKSVLISSNRVGTRGLDDIFEITTYRTFDDSIEDDEEIDSGDHSIYLAISTRDSISREPISCTLSLKSNQSTITATTSVSGRYIKTIERLKGDVNISTDSDGYYNKDIMITIPSLNDLSADTTINVTILLEKVEIGTEIVLENIYYDYDKSDIRKDAEPSLNELVVLLEANPKIKIELASHTDCRGEDAYNQDLSTRRASSARGYMIQNGISASRIISKGYGATNPVNNCSCDDCTDEDHQQNRRTSFKVLSVN